MGKKKAIEICKNLQRSMENAKLKDDSDNTVVFSNPTISKSKLQTIYTNLVTKYKLTSKDLK
tara:strand:+ start:117 stop:302 length:186 start_codon:yes stop_codon:yes gene_type:complete